MWLWLWCGAVVGLLATSPTLAQAGQQASTGSSGRGARPPVLSGTLTQRNDGGRTIVVGDVHGCKVELLLLLAKANVEPGLDTVVLLGDAIGKGPEPYEVLQHVRRNGYLLLKGNHELGLLRLVDQLQHKDRHTELTLSARLELRCKDPARAGKAMCREDTRALLARLSDDDLRYLRQLPSYITYAYDPYPAPRPSPRAGAPGHRGVVLVHGGLEPSKPLGRQTAKAMATIRNVLPNGEPSGDKGYNASVGSPWASLWRGCVLAAGVVWCTLGGAVAQERSRQWRKSVVGSGAVARCTPFARLNSTASCRALAVAHV